MSRNGRFVRRLLVARSVLFRGGRNLARIARAGPIIAMQPLTAAAAAILDLMEPGRAYEASELRAFMPDASMDGLRELMHELWVKRRVERFGYSGWRRHESTCASNRAPDLRTSADDGMPRAFAHYLPLGDNAAVRPEDLFDYSAFDGIFK
jgi:hypothetical protein